MPVCRVFLHFCVFLHFPGLLKDSAVTASSRVGPSIGHPKAVWLKKILTGFLWISAEIDLAPPRSTGPAPHINVLQKSAPLTNSEAKAVWLKKLGPVFIGFRPTIDPGIP